MYDKRRTFTEANPSGLCECGCGQETPISTEQHGERGYYKGQHLRFIPGHQTRDRFGPKASNWRGGRWVHKTGYVYVYAPDHPKANADKCVLQHRLVMEHTIGRLLAPNEHVHHINGNKTDNRPENLVMLTKVAHHALHAGEYLRRWRETHPEEARANAVRAGKAGGQAKNRKG